MHTKDLIKFSILCRKCGNTSRISLGAEWPITVVCERCGAWEEVVKDKNPSEFIPED